MNILYLSNHLNVGGITSYIFSLAKGFKKRGHRVYVASSGGEVLPNFFQEGIPFIKVPLKTKCELSLIRQGISFIKLSRFIKRNNIDIIHTNTRVTQVLGCLLAKSSNIAHITTCHGFFKKRWSRIKFPCWGDKVIAISGSVKEHLVLDFAISESQVSLIYNGIDLDRFNIPQGQNIDQISGLLKEFKLFKGPVVGIIARLSEVKGHVYLIRAMKQVIAKFPTAKLFIIGEGSLYHELKKLTTRINIGNNVIFLPKVYDNIKALSVMDVFVMPSLQEGLGLSLMEAMAAGLAVVGSEVGGIKNLITHGENGLMVKPADVNQLADAIIELIKDRQKAQALGSNARAFIYRNFSLSEMLLHTEEVYRECLENVK